MNRLTDTSRDSRNCSAGKLYGCYEIEHAITKLADYEDTNLSPAEITKLREESVLRQSYEKLCEQQQQTLIKTAEASEEKDKQIEQLSTENKRLEKALSELKQWAAHYNWMMISGNPKGDVPYISYSDLLYKIDELQQAAAAEADKKGE